MRVDDAAQPPFESLRGRRQAALFSPLVPCHTKTVPPTRAAHACARRTTHAARTRAPRQVSHVSRLPSTGEFDPSPHARRMCNLCGMTRTCAICRSVSSFHSTPFASPHKAPGVTRSLLAVGGQRTRELPRATLSGACTPPARVLAACRPPIFAGPGQSARARARALSRGFL